MPSEGNICSSRLYECIISKIFFNDNRISLIKTLKSLGVFPQKKIPKNVHKKDDSFSPSPSVVVFVKFFVLIL